MQKKGQTAAPPARYESYVKHLLHGTLFGDVNPLRTHLEYPKDHPLSVNVGVGRTGPPHKACWASRVPLCHVLNVRFQAKCRSRRISPQYQVLGKVRSNTAGVA